MASREAKISRLALLTRAAWEADMPAPLTRPMYAEMAAHGAVHDLVLRHAPQISSALVDRAQRLMTRCRRVGEYLERYEAQGYELILPGDGEWPQRILALGNHAPQFLFLRGNADLLAQCGIAVAGSRRILRETMALAEHCGRRLADEGYVMISGGASGVDSAAQKALIESGGRLILVPAQPVAFLLNQYPYLRQPLADGRLLFLCDALPDDPFSAAKALLRNQTIYALADAAIVVAARNGVGGSWRGAADCLRAGYTPVHVLQGCSADMEGNRALMARGAYALDLGRSLSDQLTHARICQTDMFHVCVNEGGILHADQARGD